jgi:hypothetical protein
MVNKKKKLTIPHSEFKVDFPTTVTVLLDMRNEHCMYMWEGKQENKEKQVPFIIKDIPNDDGVYFAVLIIFFVFFYFPFY